MESGFSAVRGCGLFCCILELDDHLFSSLYCSEKRVLSLSAFCILLIHLAWEIMQLVICKLPSREGMLLERSSVQFNRSIKTDFSVSGNGSSMTKESEFFPGAVVF